MTPVFSCVIPCRTLDDPKLKDLIASIRAQDFPQEQVETIVVTEGDSEQAKAIGIRKAKGGICAMFCADNLITNPYSFKAIYLLLIQNPHAVGVYTKHYHHEWKDNSLNRYFSLIGGNDPVSFYLNKNDRLPWWEQKKDECWSAVYFPNSVPSLGDNGFFYRSSEIKRTNIDHYYPMDNAEDLRCLGEYRYIRDNSDFIWHRTTDGNLIKFLIKRYKYARDLYCDRTDRRWKMLDTREDYWKLTGFILATITVIPCLYISIKGFFKVRDFAWAWHWPVCAGFLITYGILVCRNVLKSASLFLQSAVKNVSKSVSKVLKTSPFKTTR